MHKIRKCLLIVFLAIIIALSVAALAACNLTEGSKVSLTVTYDDSHKVVEGDTLDSLKPYLTVKYADKDGNVTTVTDFTLSGTLSKGESKVNITYNGVTYTVKITVEEKQADAPNPPHPTEYTVTFVADGQTVSTSKYTADNKNITAPEVPVKIGYNGQWEQYALTTGDVTVNAIYTAKQYIINLNYDGATAGNEQQTITVTYNQPIGGLPTPTKEGYAYGWYWNDNLVTSTYVWNFDSEETIVFAVKWEIATASLKYVLTDDGESYFIDKINLSTEKEIIIPSVWKGKPIIRIQGESTVEAQRESSPITKVVIGKNVVTLGEDAFYGCDGIREIEIPNGIISIEESAFHYCTNLVSVFIPASVIKIGDQAFSYCNNLKSISVSSENKYYASSNGVLFNKDMTILIRYPQGKTDISYSIPNTVTTVYSSAFSDTTTTMSLINIYLPAGLENIEKYAFGACSKLKTFNLPNGIKRVGLGAFPEHNESGEIFDFPFYTQYKACVYIGNVNNPYLVLVCARYLNVTVEEINPNTKVIAEEGLLCMHSVCIANEITVPDSVQYIGKSAFNPGISSSGQVSTVNIGANVIEIGEYAFTGPNTSSCIRAINVSPDNQHYTSENGVLYNKDKTELIAYTSANADITEFTVPSTVKIIKSNAFHHAKYLTDIILPESLEIIEDGAFYGCSSLTNITIPDKVTSLSESTFCGCTNLTAITIPNSILYFGRFAFYFCDNLKDVYFIGSIEEWCNIDFVGYFSSNPLCGGRNTVRNLYINGKLVTELIIPQGVKEIKEVAFSGCSITSVVIPNTVTAIRDDAFIYCTNLEEVYFNGSIAQWNMIEIGFPWGTISATKVICLDGEVSLIK